MLAACFIRFVKRRRGVRIAEELSAENALRMRTESSLARLVCAGWRVRPHRGRHSRAVSGRSWRDSLLLPS